MADVKQPYQPESDSSEEENFVDAKDEIESTPPTASNFLNGSVPTLDECLGVAFKTLNLFLSNRFEEAKELVQNSCDSSMYHSISYTTILGIQAMMTMDQVDIANALEASRKTLTVIKRVRKKRSILSWNRSETEYTIEELHAELIYAESLLTYALVTFLEDENLISFVKAAFKVRRCYLAYQECHKILGRFQFASASGKAHFESGVRFGYGLFNILISVLPPRIMHLLEFVGFSGNRDVGMRELEAGMNVENGLRTPLIWMALLSYNLVAYYAFGLTHNNLAQSETILKKALVAYPESVMFLFFQGKFEQVSGRFLSAVDCYERAVGSQNQWMEFHHLCFWEEMLTHSLLADWLLAMKFAEILYQKSRWSKALYQYLKACFMLELISEYKLRPGEKSDDQTISDMQKHVAQLMEDVPGLRQRIAGKSVPVEKFAAAKANKYSKEGHLCLPGVEMIFALNWSRILAADEASCIRMLAIVDEELKRCDLDPKINGPGEDFKIKKSPSHPDQALAIFLRGAILRELRRNDDAKRWLMACPVNWTESQLSAESTYILPGSWVELAQIAIDSKDLKLARKYLEEARGFTKYYHIARMQFRIHALQQEISAIEGSSGGGKGRKGALETVTNDASLATKSKSIPTSLGTTTTK